MHSRLCLLLLSLFTIPAAFAQGTVPVFQLQTSHGPLAFAGNTPAAAKTTTLDTVLAPITLTFETAKGKQVVDAMPQATKVAHSPLFEGYKGEQASQYGDSLLHASLRASGTWHTLLSTPQVLPVTIAIPAGYGYLLTEKQTGRTLAVVDSDYVERQLFAQLPKDSHRLVIAFTRDTTFYADGDATICCTWGTHGIDPATHTSFVLSTYLQNAPRIVTEHDLQPLSEQLGEFFLDPLHNPSLYGRDAMKEGNVVPAWRQPFASRGCGGRGIGSSYFLLEPTDTNTKNNIPTSPAFAQPAHGSVWHLQNIALPAWYVGTFGGSGSAFSFPDAQVLPSQASACGDRRHQDEDDSAGELKPTAQPLPHSTQPNGRALIGYWVGQHGSSSSFTLPEVSPQWDVVIVAFASPVAHGALAFHPPAGTSAEQFKADVATLQKQGRKVLISLGGGGAFFHLEDPADIPPFISSVEEIVSTYGFDGIDLDFESPSLSLVPGDRDFRHPTTPSTVHLIQALHQLHTHFGSRFMISLVPEGTQIAGGLPSYGGQFGSYLPIAYGIRDILSFVDMQDYNTPPLEGLDGRIYQVGGVDYDAAMTELLLQGFNAGHREDMHFAPLPASKVAVGFLSGFTSAEHMQSAMHFLIDGHAPQGSSYSLRKPGGYPDMLGAMLWTIDADRRDNYSISNTVGPQLHRSEHSR